MQPRPGQLVLRVSWKDVWQGVSRLAQQIAPNSILCPVPRGGIIVAGLILQLRPDCQVITAYPHNPQSTFMVDDIMDTGRTLSRSIYSGLGQAVLFKRMGSVSTASRLVVGAHISNDYWLQFPWEPGPQCNPDMAAPEAPQNDNDSGHDIVHDMGRDERDRLDDEELRRYNP